MAEPESKPPTLTVSSLTSRIKELLEGSFTKIYVEAEISGWKRYPSGHCYFTLKDDGAQISAVMFASSFDRCKARDGLKDGAKVLVYANVSVYPPRGNYQLVVLAAKLAGEGDLMQRYLELKSRLEAEGLFDAARKRHLPTLPRRIGIVTSEAGAVIHDMCTVLTRRFPALEIRLFPALVQGVEAPATLVAGIDYFNTSSWRADLLIIARGGGSFEDLFCFNDEVLVRAVAASTIPTISAVGHETDFTLCDFAADKRAGTPSIAAEIAVPLLRDLTDRISLADEKLASALTHIGEFFAQRIDHLNVELGAALLNAHGRAERQLLRLAPCLKPALMQRFHEISARLEKAMAELKAYSPYGVLERGYSLTTTVDGRVLKDAEDVRPGEKLVTRLAHGAVSSTVDVV